MLPSGNYTFNDIHTVLPSGATSISLNSLISQGKWGDDDGDGQGTNGVTASGSISLTIKDKDGTTVNRSDTLSICNAPYKVTLDSTGGSLTTRYGVPNSNTFSGGSATYYIKPDSSGSCYFVQWVRPNLYNGTDGYAGPANIWNPNKGFLTQSTNPSFYDRNFPTTGSDGLYFDLEIPTGIDGSQLTWSPVTHSGITATVRWTRPLTGRFTSPDGRTIQADEWIRDKSKNVARVTLTGPRASSSQIGSNYPSSLARPVLPQTFELVGRDSSGNEVRYGFVLRQWFVHRAGESKLYEDQLAWCRSLGYRMPRIRDLTNSNYNNLGATPSSSDNYYMRYIGAGFFTEWGSINRYANVGFVNGYYWTSDATVSYRFGVDSTGNIYGVGSRHGDYAVCTAP